MNTLFSFLDIDLYQARISLPGAKKTSQFQCFALKSSEIVVVVVGGVVSSEEDSLLHNMLIGCGQSIEGPLSAQALQGAKRVLMMVPGYDSQQVDIPVDIQSTKGEVTQTYHPRDLLSGEKKPLAYKGLLGLFAQLP